MLLAKIFYCLLVVSLLYVYINHNREFTATASAIRQIWSGSCRLSCRQSECSGFSGLSGLVQRRSQNYDSRLSDKVKQVQTSINNQAGPSGICVCETCPCFVLEKVLRTCGPATNIYSALLEMFFNFYYKIVAAWSDLYVYVDRVVTCGVSCQRPDQLTALKVNSADKISFMKASSLVKDDTAKILGKQILNLKSSAISLRRQSKDVRSKDDQSKDVRSKDDQSKDDQSKDDQYKEDQSKDVRSKDDQSKDVRSKDDQYKEDQSKDDQSKDDQSKDELAKANLHASTGGHNIALNQRRDSLRLQSESVESGEDSNNNCSKCVQAGKLCMKICPRSKEK